jgi:hypothetical protein
LSAKLAGKNVHVFAQNGPSSAVWGCLVTDIRIL